METKTQKSFGAFVSNRTNISKYLPFALLVVFVIVLEIATKGVLLKPGNLAAMANGVFAMMIMSLGALFVFAAGGMDFSIGSLAGICFLEIMMILRNGLTTTNYIIAIVACVATCLLVEFINAFVAIKLGLPPIICTMATNSAMRGILQTAVSVGEISAPMGFTEYDVLGIKIAVLVAVAILAFILLERTTFGKHLKAIGGNPEAARQAGIKVERTRIIGYLILGLCVAIAAIIVAPRQSVVRSTSGSGMELNVLIAILLGGVPLTGGSNTRTISAILGCIITIVMENGLLLCGVDTNVVTFIKGAIFIIMAFVTTERSSRKIVM